MTEPKPPTIRLSPTQGALLLSVGDREFPIPATADGMDLLVGIVRRWENLQRPPVAEPPPYVPTYPPGAELRFVPPHPSPWREVAFFPPAADFCPVVVVAEHKSGSVLCRAPDGHSYLLPPAHLRSPQGRKFTTSGKPDRSGQVGLTLADLGL